MNPFYVYRRHDWPKIGLEFEPRAWRLWRRDAFETLPEWFPARTAPNTLAEV